MKQLLTSLVLSAMMLCMGIGTTSAQSTATEGRVFWVAFMKNGQHSSANSVEQGVTIAAKRATGVTLTVPGTTWSHTMNVAANSVQTYIIPTSANVYQCNSSSTPVTGGLRIAATDTVSVTAYTYAPTCLDGTSVLPEQSLGTEYMVHTQAPMQHGDYAAKSHFAVVAVEDGTDVTITPSHPVITSNGTSSAAPFTVTMQAGEVVYLESAIYNSEDGDLTGTLISTDGCKKVAVFNGNDVKAMPRVQSEWTGDVLMEQAYPLNSYGRKFIVTNSMDRCADIIRITAAADNDTVYVNGTFAAVLQQGEYHQWYSTSTVNHVTTSQPSACHLYLTSAAYCSPSYSDPAMVWIPPVEQSINNALFCTIHPQPTATYHIEHDYVNIVAKTADIGTATLDGAALTGFIPVASTANTYSYCRVELTHGSHRLHVGGDGFVAHVYGMGYSMSYAYLAGSKAMPTWAGPLVRLTAAGPFCQDSPITLEVTGHAENDITWNHGDGTTVTNTNQHTHTYHTAGTYTVYASLPTDGCRAAITLQTNVTILAPQTIHLNHQVEFGDTLVIGGQSHVITSDTTLTEDGTSAAGCDSTTIHHITTTVTGARTDTVLCDGASTDYHGTTVTDAGTYTHTYTNARGAEVTDTLVVRTGSSTRQTIDTSICQGSAIVFHNHIYRSEGAYTDTLRTTLGCDSITTIRLHLIQPSLAETDTTLCPGTALTMEGSTFTNSGTHTLTLAAASGCDSILTIHLDYYPAAHSELYDTLENGESYHFNGQALNLPGTYYAHMSTVHGCDSLVTLYLSARPSTIWFPNIITPDQSDNRYFKAFGTYILEIDIYIYNRHGELMTELHGMDDQWDGTHKGKGCPEGAYAYIARYRTADHPTRVLTAKGTVLIVR